MPGSDGDRCPLALALRPRQVAELLNVSERTVRALVASGRLRSVKIGAARLIPFAELEKLLSESGSGDG